MASLQELPDDELDKLFRSSAEEFEPPYHSEDWNSLRQRLDDDDRSRFLYRFVYWGLPLLLLLLTTVSLVMEPVAVRSSATKPARQQEATSTGKVPKTGASDTAGPGDKVAAGTVSSESSRSGASSKKTATPSAPSEAGTTTSDENRSVEKPLGERTAVVAKPEAEARSTSNRLKPTSPITNTGSTDHTVNRRTKTTIPTRISARSAVKGRLDKPVSGENKEAAETASEIPKTGKTAFRFSRKGTNQSAESASAGTIGDANSGSLAKNRPANPAPGSETPAVSKAVTDRPTVDLTRETPVLPSETEMLAWLSDLTYIEARSPKKQPLPSLPELDLEPMRPPVGPRIIPPAIPVIGYPALSIRFIMAPDLNFVGDSPKAATDLEIGLVGEYRFARRFTIQSGVLRSTKRYNAPGKSYTKPPHWYGPMYQSVDAVCTVLDIPVNLRFDVMLNERRRWFVSAGLSSYIMQKERYEYNYPPGVSPNPTMPQYFSWSGKTGLHKWSHLNFSFGYERNFSSDGPLRRFSWQVEPFLKQAQGATLGYGKIRLTSAGVFFSLRYRL
ncbi:hypothetical protein [Larkinella rosea]|uniref:Outer membrane protein beta-barrel domain-containing protein n=1 Tax=Larkinella rosea TaxID=2025312 RepID=A0A3P1BTY8_9BACT|nr:hypothetical protein [Larkinella rosea]RRB04571.1 hypothetical protein EHT25_13855 [Larkinella rosea]